MCPSYSPEAKAQNPMLDPHRLVLAKLEAVAAQRERLDQLRAAHETAVEALNDMDFSPLDFFLGAAETLLEPSFGLSDMARAVLLRHNPAREVEGRLLSEEGALHLQELLTLDVDTQAQLGVKNPGVLVYGGALPPDKLSYELVENIGAWLGLIRGQTPEVPVKPQGAAPPADGSARPAATDLSGMLRELSIELLSGQSKSPPTNAEIRERLAQFRPQIELPVDTPIDGHQLAWLGAAAGMFRTPLDALTQFLEKWSGARLARLAEFMYSEARSRYLGPEGKYRSASSQIPLTTEDAVTLLRICEAKAKSLGQAT